MSARYPTVASGVSPSKSNVIPHFDAVIIGGGVVGCATARRFALAGARVLLLEKADDILAGASKGNSALLHTGFDAPADSLELALMQRGYAEYRAIRESLNLPLLETGAMVVAWTDEEKAKLDQIRDRALANGVQDVRLLNRAEVLTREPLLAAHLRAALLVPGEHVIDGWSTPLAYITQAIVHGAQVWRKCALLGGTHDSQGWRLETSSGAVRADHVVNCAGLYGDDVERLCLGDASFEIRPRKGQFVVFDKPASRLLTHIILPVPTEQTKGIVLCRTIYGNVLVGPTAEEQPERDRATVEQSTLRELVDRAVHILPALQDIPVNAVYAGLRPATETKAYRIRHDEARNWLTLGGIRSTGLTAALGLAAYAAETLGFASAADAQPIAVPNLAEHETRDWQRPGYGEIICHCEMVTRREIEASFASPLPPSSESALKRRTRVMMGRCQGFYCGARVRRLLQEHGHD